MSEDLKVLWELNRCNHDDSKMLSHLLANGWEPFAVTVTPEKMREHQSEGHCTYFDHVVWLKRLKTA